MNQHDTKTLNENSLKLAVNKKIESTKYGDGRDDEKKDSSCCEPERKMIYRTVHVNKIKARKKNKWLVNIRKMFLYFATVSVLMMLVEYLLRIFVYQSCYQYVFLFVFPVLNTILTVVLQEILVLSTILYITTTVICLQRIWKNFKNFKNFNEMFV